ncbi:alpha/beta hydrolase [Rhodococcus sp. BP-349]|uniref:alpha/beta fold hydrolase n=1 Tax=unclassified Rhodococcus (in: high G+C Gram-positive bacteria) TaxID=192944 RepID=UPI001C9B7B05|nr:MULTISPECIES: alpha/beta hydrolase [unclassified Rhodococcus (in: high G+C Gram-positive bacteria)]MBY6539648.1 alpha/beta hydrolase [Rhodococcus sp. BP-363]MBY6544024.1 alpha/beta hydrolase [Rhodococcus sp. BP-369]MBY6563254.1 alpha/beta hydrolase [Rhodococcus sp. BP-370]MBY6577546.1 alpha/beta hydrolase [Rhodococcus sp. BP-364]MBY6586847.1 alpha/beta hydrolase [Rhodococcus sp. BP-358]
MAIREALGRDGTSLVYRVTGDVSARPLVLLHGWAQTGACWGDDLLSDLAERYRVIAVDLRGHGMSGAPADGYDRSALWAGDVHAVLEQEGIRSGAVLLGWSYGGLVLCDYLSVYGTGAVAGVVFVAAITAIGPDRPGGAVGTAMRAAIPGAMSEDSRVAIRALASFGNALTGPGAGHGAAAQALFGASLATRPRVRSAVFRRDVGHDETLVALDVPALVLHGTADTVVDVSAGRHTASVVPGAATSWWEGVDHGPFVADPARFLGEVTGFVDALGRRT